MTTIKQESFEIQLNDQNSTVFFKGALRLSGTQDYTPILAMLMGTLVNRSEPIVLDVRELDFLNSSGITMFSKFVIAARDHADIRLKVLASESNPWHSRSLKNLQRLMPSLTVQLS